jgi:hypothetical protein
MYPDQSSQNIGVGRKVFRFVNRSLGNLFCDPRAMQREETIVIPSFRLDADYWLQSQRCLSQFPKVLLSIAAMTVRKWAASP